MYMLIPLFTMFYICKKEPQLSDSYISISKSVFLTFTDLTRSLSIF